jgi:hypothetical protein
MNPFALRKKTSQRTLFVAVSQAMWDPYHVTTKTVPSAMVTVRPFVLQTTASVSNVHVPAVIFSTPTP